MTSGHSHSFGQERARAGEQRTILVIAITAVMMVVEIVAGMAYGSMAVPTKYSVRTITKEPRARSKPYQLHKKAPPPLTRGEGALQRQHAVEACSDSPGPPGSHTVTLVAPRGLEPLLPP
jgi:hypothetical protein